VSKIERDTLLTERVCRREKSGFVSFLPIAKAKLRRAARPGTIVKAGHPPGRPLVNSRIHIAPDRAGRNQRALSGGEGNGQTKGSQCEAQHPDNRPLHHTNSSTANMLREPIAAHELDHPTNSDGVRERISHKNDQIAMFESLKSG
jgi:hypothetical protein